MGKVDFHDFFDIIKLTEVFSKIFMMNFIKRFVIMVKWLFGGRKGISPHHSQEDIYFEVLSALAEAIEAKDHSTRGHSERMVKHVDYLGKKLGLSKQELKDLEMAAVLHDVGKIGIDKSVFLKPGKLTSEEYEIIKKHSTIGANIISRVSFLKGAAEYVKHHHERWDSNGYPDKLKGNDIPLGARILAVVDSFDAMMSERPYKKPMTLSEAFVELKKNSGSQFDAKVVDEFLKYDFQSEKL
ncbi:MAG: HD domain-containing protein [Elusimicrobia bacterium]|nr:HD domain-containing protein [Elusimicrobiota bacterium]